MGYSSAARSQLLGSRSPLKLTRDHLNATQPATHAAFLMTLQSREFVSIHSNSWQIIATGPSRSESCFCGKPHEFLDSAGQRSLPSSVVSGNS